MSSSGPAIFDDDLACDVRGLYRKSLLDRVPDEEATRQGIERWAGLGPDEEPVLWLALAAAQFEVGRLDEHVRDRAVEVIDSGRDLVRWHEAGPEFAAERAAVLAVLREQLTGPQPKRKTLRRPWREVTDLEAGMVLAWTASDGTVALLRVVQRQEDEFDHSVRPVLERLAWTDHDVPPAEVLAGLPAAADDGAWRPEDGGGPHYRPGVYIPFRLKKGDPDWRDVGLTVCGHVPARPGDDGDWSLGAAGLMWSDLPNYLELAVVGKPPE